MDQTATQVDEPAGVVSPVDQETGLNAGEEASKQLDALGEALSKKRAEAIQGRTQSGIEQQWIEDEEFYQGIDDANRNEHSNAWRTKPPGQYNVTPQSATRSTVFPNITRPYCDAAAARIADMLLPTDDANFSIQPLPIPDLVDLANGNLPTAVQVAQSTDPTPPNVQQTQIAQGVQQAMLMVNTAKDKAKKAQIRMEDWQVKTQYQAEVRLVIEDAARIGSGVLKGPFPIKKKMVAMTQPQNGQPAGIEIKEELLPASKRIDPWDFFPDPSCGSNIHDGSYTWERDHITERQLRELKKLPGYLESAVDLCIEEGPKETHIATDKQQPDHNLEDSQYRKRYEIWYYHGTVGREELTAAGMELDPEDRPQLPALITMVNDHVIKAALNPLDSGDFPYDIMPWQRKSGMPWGNGVARHGRTPQRIVTAATRNLMDNAGLGAGAQIVLKQELIEPADGQMNLTPRKFWYVAEDADIDDVRKAMTFFTVPMVQRELDAIIQYGLKLMEDATGLPMLLQGQQGKAPDTVGGMTMLNNNASAVLRRLARTFDDCVTEPHIRRYYTWLLQYGEDEEKGDFTIDARGSSALVERDLQAQEMVQLWTLAQNPTSGLDPKKVAKELLKSRKFDPTNFEYDDAQWQQLVGNWQKILEASKASGDPRVQVAQLNAQAADARLTKEQQFESQENQKNRDQALILDQVNERIEEMKLNGAQEISFEELKAMLAGKAMALTTQKELSAASLSVDLHKHHVPAAVNPLDKPAIAPPTEPAGKAPSGQAFQR